jgi:hypothetical protein
MLGYGLSKVTMLVITGGLRSTVYGKTVTRCTTMAVKLQAEAKHGPVATKTPTVAAYMACWFREVVKPNLAPLMTYATRRPWSGRTPFRASARICSTGSRSGGADVDRRSLPEVT